MILESIGALDHLDALDAVIDAQFFEDIKAIHHVAEGGIAPVHEVETSRGELCFVEEQEELRRPIAKSLVGMGPAQSPKGGERKDCCCFEQTNIFEGFVVEGVGFAWNANF